VIPLSKQNVWILAAVILFISVLTATVAVLENDTVVEPAVALQSERQLDRPSMSLRDLNNAFVELAEAANPTVVTVFTEKVLRMRQSPGFFFDHPFNDFFGEFFERPGGARGWEREYRHQGLGSACGRAARWVPGFWCSA
jgi:hypothetical protein